jgi:deoxyribose-phosphate aldolase
MLVEANQQAVHTEPSVAPAATYEDLANFVALSLADATLTEGQVFAGCEQARQLGLSQVLARPSDVDLAAKWVAPGPCQLACLTGYPGGSSTTPARLYESRDILRRGVRDLVVTINVGKLVSRKFLYLESELLQLAENCRQFDAQLRILLEIEDLQQDHVLIGIRLCKRTAVNGMDLLFRRAGAEYQGGVARYVLHHAKGKLSVSVHSPTVSLEHALALRTLGVRRVVTPQAEKLLAAWRSELERREQEKIQADLQPSSDATVHPRDVEIPETR